jgi:2'-deoxynucleoside 5'-phosphate N-hydrolase
MNIYFAASTGHLDQQRATFSQIISGLQDLQANILDTWIVEAIKGVPATDDSRAILQRQQALLKQADTVVAEVSTPSLGVGAMIMFAIEQRIPVLCLYPDTSNEAEISESVKGLASSLVTTRSYNEATLASVLQKFLDKAEGDHFQRFNFIANKEIAGFIEDQAQRESKTKSEFLRDYISSYMDDYRKRYDAQ